MNVEKLIAKLEALGYSYVVVTETNAYDADITLMTAVDPKGYQIALKVDGNTVLDRKEGSPFWDIMFIGEESFI